MSASPKILLSGTPGTINLGREGFGAAVFKRDGHKCLCCNVPAVDAHHIIERKLFPDHDGGYYLGNGASLCGKHHMDAEKTLISVEELRRLAGIGGAVIPADMDPAEVVDKWANPILKDGRRIKGIMFHTEQVQKILGEAGLLDIFVSYYKYPRTYHLPSSPGASADDKVLKSTSALVGQRVISTKKMDGENTTLYHDYMHARSIDGRSHPSRNRVKQFHAMIQRDIFDGWRICGENVTAVHSIRYENLKSPFLGFSIWDEHNVCRPWEETLEWFGDIGIEPVEVVYDGIFDEQLIVEISRELIAAGEEGTVTRLASEIAYRDFPSSVCKYVRESHVKTGSHWMTSEIVENGFAEDAVLRF